MPAEVNCYVLDALIMCAKRMRDTRDFFEQPRTILDSSGEKQDLDIIIHLAEKSLEKGDPNGI